VKEGDEEEEFEGSSEDLGEGQLEEANPDKVDDLLTSEIENRQPRRLDEKEVEVVGVYEHHDKETPSEYSPPAFVLLRDKQNRQVLIWVGRFEAYAISVALEGVPFDRPMTHDLLKNVLDRLGGRVEHVLIDDLWQETYYAKITVSMNGTTIEIDSRPSDAIALALRARAPIYMAEDVLQQANIEEEI